MGKFFGTFLGVEFKEDSLTVTFLKNNLSGISLVSSASFPLRDDDSNISGIREHISHHGVRADRIFVSIPDKWAVAKFTEIPLTRGRGMDALSQLVRFEIERHIPFHIEDVLYDFQILAEKDTAYAVVFVAVPKVKVDYAREFLEKLSIQPDGITITSLAALNAFEFSGASRGGWQEVIGFTRKPRVLGRKGEVNILLCIGKENASLAIIGNGVCTHLKSFVFDESKLSDIISAAYLRDRLSELSIENFSKLILSGDISVPGLADALKEKLGVDVVTINPFNSFKGSDTYVPASSVGACLGGLGLGTYRINILPHKAIYGIGIKKTVSLSTKVFIGLILFLVMGIFAIEAAKQKMFLGKIEEALRKNEPGITAIEGLSSDINSLKKQRDFLLSVKDNEVALDILAELTGILPKDTWITNLNYKGFKIKDEKRSGGELIINGYSASSSGLISILENSPYFEKVEFVGPIRKKREKEGFKLKAMVKSLKKTPGRQG